MNKKFQRRAGWFLLISTLLVILAIMSYLILITQRDVAIVNQQNAPTSVEDALIASGLDGDLGIEEALNDGSIITLESVIGTEDFGVATKSYKDGVFTLDIIITALDPPQGVFYEGWLEGDEVVSTGTLIKDTLEDDVYSVTFTSTDDLSDLSTVVITEEPLILGQDNKQ